MLAWIFSDCREDQSPAACSAAKFDTPLLCSGVFDFGKKAGCLQRRGSGYIIFFITNVRFWRKLYEPFTTDIRGRV